MTDPTRITSRREARGLPPIDWSKPLMHKDGQRVTLIETAPNGTGNFPDRTRIVNREGVEGMTALWWFKEDGCVDGPLFHEKDLINVPE